MAELQANGRIAPLDALIDGIRNSDPAYTIVGPNAEPFAMFGTVPTADDKYRFVWLLGTDRLVTEHRTEFLRKSRGWMNRLHEKAPILGNYVHKENTVHIRWLKWVGCNFVGEREINGHTFIEFLHV